MSASKTLPAHLAPITRKCFRNFADLASAIAECDRAEARRIASASASMAVTI